MQTKQKSSAYSELVDLVARSDPHRVLSFRLSPKVGRRVETLINREKDSLITPAEKDELDTYMHLSRIVMLAQIQAHKILNGKRARKNT
ncbi:hypothetical protein L0337_08525 [candidate division KSB1 bacterium]|nr:hypothetical protein [candidate division KSB1 bacterium]